MDNVLHMQNTISVWDKTVLIMLVYRVYDIGTTQVYEYLNWGEQSMMFLKLISYYDLLCLLGVENEFLSILVFFLPLLLKHPKGSWGCQVLYCHLSLIPATSSDTIHLTFIFIHTRTSTLPPDSQACDPLWYRLFGILHLTVRSY